MASALHRLRAAPQQEEWPDEDRRLDKERWPEDDRRPEKERWPEEDRRADNDRWSDEDERPDEEQPPEETAADRRVRPVERDQKIDPFANKQPSLGRRGSRAVIRFVAIFCFGVAATLAWQSYGDAARAIVANSSPRLAWLTPPAARAAQNASDTVRAVEPAVPSADLQRLNGITLDLAALRQSVDQLAAQLAAGNQQIAGDIATLQAAQQAILRKITPPPPRPAAAPARNPAPPPSLVSPDAPPAH
jgi:hypothetical protein